MGFIPDKEQSNSKEQSNTNASVEPKRTLAVYQNEGQYGYSMRDDAPNNHESMASTLQAEDDKIYEDPESNKLFLDNLKPIPENKRVAGGPDHQLNGYGILRSTYGANTNGEIARKKVARLVSKERFEEIERMPAAEQNAEVHKITNGYALTDTPVNIGFDGNEQISPTSHSELKGTRDLTAIKVKTNQGGNYAHLNSADRSKNNADISLTYNPQLKTEDFSPEATPEKYLPKDRTTEETPNTYWTGLSEANSLKGTLQN